MMGEHLLELDPEHDILEAFACFDEGDKGYVDVKEMRKWLSELGDRMSEQEVSSLCRKHRTGLEMGHAGQDLQRAKRLTPRVTACSMALSPTDKAGSTTQTLRKRFASMTASRNEPINS